MSKYILSQDLQEAVRVAEITERPLLLKGEPGTGKSLLAEHLAQEKNLPLFTWNVKSTSKAKDGLYFYDAVQRLNDSRFSEELEKVSQVKNYIELGALGKAFSLGRPSVVLIDEIDKADIEFPNDLLLELDKMEFSINETNETIRASKRPLVLVTSNNEKELPEAFLRRCIFHYIRFPSKEMMKAVVETHFPGLAREFIESALSMFYAIRQIPSLQKKPSTSELLDWIKILVATPEVRLDSKNIPFAGSLLKSEADFRSHLN